MVSDSCSPELHLQSLHGPDSALRYSSVNVNHWDQLGSWSKWGVAGGAWAGRLLWGTRCSLTVGNRLRVEPPWWWHWGGRWGACSALEAVRSHRTEMRNWREGHSLHGRCGQREISLEAFFFPQMFLPGDWSFLWFINLCSNKTEPWFGVAAERKGGAVLLLGPG